MDPRRCPGLHPGSRQRPFIWIFRKDPSRIAGNLTLHEERDAVLNRYTRIARLQSPAAATKLDVPPLLDAILVELTAERLVLSGIERHEDVAIARIEDVAQTWVCWFDLHT